ncbi:MAG: hypothetical protein AAGI23_14470 [Bacteroidota bacterium]
MTFTPYRNRSIAFQQAEQIGDWHVKIYTISHQSSFAANKTLQEAIKQLPDWLKAVDDSCIWALHRLGFLIVHEGEDGIWILLYWWMNGEMLGNYLYIANISAPTQIKASPYPYGLVCVWELEVVQHERTAWVRHLLKEGEADVEGYLEDVL